MARRSFTLSDQVSSDLNYVSDRLSVSASSLVELVLTSSLEPMLDVLRNIPVDASELDESSKIRLRGESAALIKQKLQNVKDMADDLLSGVGSLE